MMPSSKLAPSARPPSPRLCLSAESLVVDNKDGALADLVNLSRSGTATAQGFAAAVLSELAAGGGEGEERRAALAAAGCVSPLISLVSTGHGMAKGRAASALWHLSVDDSICSSISKAGGVSSLAQLLDDGPTASHEHAIGLLTRLAVRRLLALSRPRTPCPLANLLLRASLRVSAL